MTRIGLRGAPCGVVDTAGVAQLDSRKKPTPWWIAASDKWHDPRRSPSVRQRSIDGTPVVETKLAVPGGDVVHRAFAVADQGGALIYEFENRSPSAVVVAVPAGEASTTAANPGTVPQGADLGGDVRAFPLAHASTVRFAWALERARWRRTRTLEMSALAATDAVVRGWVQACERASRVSTAGVALTTARCTTLLASAREVDALLHDDAARGVLAIAERVRMGDSATTWIDVLADAVSRIARRPGDSPWSWRALSIAADVFTVAGEARAASDTVAAWQRCLDSGVQLVDVRQERATSELARAVAYSAGAEDRIARPVSPLATQLFSDALIDVRGTNFEAHGVHAGPHHRLSLAVRWHGVNAALLWEVDGPPGLQLTAPAVDATFRTSAAQGEALLQVAK